MSLLSLGMAIPVNNNNGNNRDSTIYFLASAENVSQESIANKKYRIIKILQMIFIISSLGVFVFGVRDNRITLQDVIICATYGALTIYCLMFVLFSIKIEQKPYLIVTMNIVTVIALFSIGGGIISSWWNMEDILHDLEMKYPDKKIVLEAKYAHMKVVSSLISIFNGIFFMAETLIMSVEVTGII